MDPLSVAASIIGILAAAAKVVEILSPVPAIIKGSQTTQQAVREEVKSCMTVLSCLQELFDGRRTLKTRKYPVQLDHLIATFTDGVLLFSQLETLALQFVGTGDFMISRIKWEFKAKEFSQVLGRLQSFKSSMTLLLNILQCKSDEIAIQQYNDITVVLQEILSNNLDIAARLEQVEESLAPRSRVDSVRNFSLHDSNGSAQDDFTKRQSVLAVRWSIAKFSFEGDLEQSRAYRKATRDTMDFSFRSSVVGSHAWSTLSDISLSDISIIAVVALPIFSSDITNSRHYSFGDFYEQIGGVLDDPVSNLEVFPGKGSTPGHKRLHDASTMNVTNNAVSFKSATSHTEKYRLVVVGSSIAKNSEIVSQVRERIHLRQSHITYSSSVYGWMLAGQSDCYECGFLRENMSDRRQYRHLNVLDDKYSALGYASMSDQYLRSGEGFMIVFSLSDRHSFDEVLIYQRQILRLKDKDYYPVIIVGIHCSQEDARETSFDEGTILAQQLGCKYVEIDSNENLDVEEAFYHLVREVRRYQSHVPLSASLELEMEPVRSSRHRRLWRRSRRSKPSLDQIAEDIQAN